MFKSTKTIELPALDFYEVIVDLIVNNKRLNDNVESDIAISGAQWGLYRALFSPPTRYIFEFSFVFESLSILFPINERSIIIIVIVKFLFMFAPPPVRIIKKSVERSQPNYQNSDLQRF